MIVTYSAPPASAPDPRFQARSMLSLGTDDFLAFWIASYSVGLPSGSPPPVRAATSMFLISLANTLLRLASTTAFLCLVVAHLEWPLIDAPSFPAAVSLSSPHHPHEELVDAALPRHLRMERGGHQCALPNRDDPTCGGSVGRILGHPGEDLDGRADLLHPRGPDEDRVDRIGPDISEVEVGLEGV